MTVTRARAVKTTELSGEVFGEMLDGKDYIKALCPDTDPSLIDDLMEAVETWGWSRIKDYDEHTLFLQQYMQIKQAAFREMGLTAFELYDRYQNIAEAAILKVTNWGDITGEFYGHLAREDTEQWFIRQLCSDSFWSADPTPVICVPAACYFEAMPTPADTAAGWQELIPRECAATAGLTTNYARAHNDEQMYLIMYYRSDLNPRSIESIQEYVNDDWALRPMMDIYGQLQRTNVGVITRPGCLIVDDNQSYCVGGKATAAVEHDFMPQGIDLTTRHLINDYEHTA